jgi:hypothetical protein
MSCAGGPDLITDGLVLDLNAADKRSYSNFSTTTWRNLVNLNQTATLTAGTIGDNKYLGRIYFEGQLGSTSIGKTASLPTWSSLNLSTNFTISIWFSFTRYGDNFFDFFLACESYLTNGFRAGMEQSTNKLGFFSTQSGGTLVLITNYSVILNTPINYVVTYDGTKGISYINGIYDNQNVGTFVAPSSTISYNSVGGGRKSDTYVSSLKIYNRALSSQEILTNFKSLKGRFQLT